MNQLACADNAVTTSISKPVPRATMPHLAESYGDPSDLYSKGREIKRALELARENIAECIGAKPDELYFTVGGSEPDNRAIKGIVHEPALRGKQHLITTRFEHCAVLYTTGAPEREDFSATYLDVHESGLARPEEVAATVRPDTALVSVMHASNEIGMIQPTAQIGAICRGHGVLFHMDVVQAVGTLPINVAEQNIGLLPSSGHRLYALKGIGASYVRRGILAQNLIDGDMQERGRQAGTGNLASIVGLAAALCEACISTEGRAERLHTLRDYLIDGALKIPGNSSNGDHEHHLSGDASLCFEGVDDEAVLLLLDR